MNEQRALEMLEELLEKGGVLKVITSEHACGGAGEHFDEALGRTVVTSPTTEEERTRCRAFEHPLTDHRHFVVHEVEALERHPAREDRVIARTLEGDLCVGRPSALLKRLTEVSRAETLAEAQAEAERALQASEEG